ncbi:S1C family serine protease [Deinococcus sonorensis]|uniref:Trypsin-like peptidase domain-containing protein n=2 Tax=Deinococcus sonorensis TaxID=309891 RepID=A0AAU7U8S7_9DEIO
MNKNTILVTVAALVGLGLGATVMRDQVPVSLAQQTGSTAKSTAAAAASAVQKEAGARLQNETNTIDIVKRYEPGLVYISTEQTVQADPYAQMMFGQGGAQVQEGVGSGFFVNAAGDILTNYHVVQDADKITIRVQNQTKTYAATVIGRAPQYDLALIRSSTLPKNLIRPIPLGDSSALAVGQKAIAMGAPFGFDFSVTEGIVSSTQRRIPIGFSTNGQGINQNAIQTDAAINPGNSGGPLLNSAGQVIGINTQIISPSGSQSGTGQSAGVGFAIPINAAKTLLPRLQAAKGGVVTAPVLGITAGLIGFQNGAGGTQQIAVGLGELRDEAKQQYKLPNSGLVIATVLPNTPASRAGLKGGTSTQQFQGGQISLGGDVITKVNGQPIDTLEDLQSYLIDKRQGDTITLTVVRGGKSRNVKVTLDASAFSN